MKAPPKKVTSVVYAANYCAYLRRYDVKKCG